MIQAEEGVYVTYDGDLIFVDDWNEINEYGAYIMIGLGMIGTIVYIGLYYL